MATKEMSDHDDVTNAPRDEEIALAVALWRFMGATQAEAARAVDISDKTVQRWESCSWWPDIQRQAADRWLKGIAARARAGVWRHVPGDGRLALEVLSRLDSRFAPPRQRISVSQDLIPYNDLTDDELRQIAAGADPAAVLAGRSRAAATEGLAE